MRTIVNSAASLTNYSFALRFLHPNCIVSKKQKDASNNLLLSAAEVEEDDLGGVH